MVGLRTLKGIPVIIATFGHDADRVRLSRYPDGSLEIDRAAKLVGCWEPWERLDCLRRFCQFAFSGADHTGLQFNNSVPRVIMSVSTDDRSSAVDRTHPSAVAATAEAAKIAGLAASPSMRTQPAPPPIRVLLVEDHPDTATALVQLLKFFGYDGQTAATAAEALELSAQQPFDIVISDLTLPDITGHELMQQIRQFSTVPSIALSGLSGDEEVDKSKDAGFCDHLFKPIDMDELHASIQRVMSSRPGQN